MAHIELFGREFEIPPYKIGALRRAAPHIDALNGINIEQLASPGNGDIAAMLEPTRHMISIVAIGLQKIDANLTDEFCQEEIGFEDLPKISRVMGEILTEAGLKSKGEVPAPSPPPPPQVPEGASTSNSGASSESLSPPE